MATRNFWIEADIDGRRTTLAGGPVRKDGGFKLTIQMRDEGKRMKALEVDGYCTNDGILVLLAQTLTGDMNEDASIKLTRVR